MLIRIYNLIFKPISISNFHQIGNQAGDESHSTGTHRNIYEVHPDLGPIYEWEPQDSFDEFLEAIHDQIEEIHEEIDEIMERAYGDFHWLCDHHEQDADMEFMKGRAREFRALINRYRKNYNPFPEHFDFLVASKAPFSSNHERVVAHALRNLGIVYKSQKRFPDCRHKAQLPFDFYFELRGRRCCIEVDGKQHFEPVEHWGGQEGFKMVQLRDSIKNQYCENNDIKLLRIPYTACDDVSGVEGLIQLFLKNF